MSKYIFDLKLKVVHAYQNGEGGYLTPSKKCGIQSDSQVRIRVNNYK